MKVLFEEAAFLEPLFVKDLYFFQSIYTFSQEPLLQKICFFEQQIFVC